MTQMIGELLYASVEDAMKDVNPGKDESFIDAALLGFDQSTLQDGKYLALHFEWPKSGGIEVKLRARLPKEGERVISFGDKAPEPWMRRSALRFASWLHEHGDTPPTAEQWRAIRQRLQSIFGKDSLGAN